MAEIVAADGSVWCVNVDRGVCVGSTLCAQLDPTSFVIDDEQKATPQAHDQGDVEMIDEAVGSCPTGAITFEPRDQL